MCSFVVLISVPVRIVDPSKDLNSYGVGSVDWKERVESWRVKQEKNMIQVTNKYPAEGRGDIEGTGSNGEDLQMYVHYDRICSCSAFFFCCGLACYPIVNSHIEHWISFYGLSCTC
jgi:hypothetical protein